MDVSLSKFEALVGKLKYNQKIKLYYYISGLLGTSFSGIEKNKGVCGGRACIIRTRIPVWTLVSYKKSEMKEVEILKAFPTLRLSDLKNAWAYYLYNRSEINGDIKDNDIIHD
jgi:uncharacterized protein (DUF433 family)